MKSLGKQEITVNVFIGDRFDRSQPETRVVYTKKDGTFYVHHFGCKHQIVKREDGFHWRYRLQSPEEALAGRIELERRLGIPSA